MTHDHHHHHHEDAPATLSFEEKMIKLLDHWTKHNADHAASYRDWAARAGENGMAQVASLLADAAAMTDSIGEKIEDLQVFDKQAFVETLFS